MINIFELKHNIASSLVYPQAHCHRSKSLIIYLLLIIYYINRLLILMGQPLEKGGEIQYTSMLQHSSSILSKCLLFLINLVNSGTFCSGYFNQFKKFSML